MKHAPEPAKSPSESNEADVSNRPERWLRCAHCAARVAREAARITVNGAHEHEFMNPSGLHYVVGCYADAPGCLSDGERSSIWTWFPGHAWQVEVCRSCLTHLGWSFHGPNSFYGLIRDRLV